MKPNKLNFLRLILPFVLIAASISACKPAREGKSSKARLQDSVIQITSNIGGSGNSIEIEMFRGKAHNHPTFAIWLEDTSGKYIQTLFVTSAIGQGIFNYGDKSAGKWKPGEVRRPAALPYWSFKRAFKNEYGTFEPTPRSKVPDAYSGATPSGNFRLTSRTDNPLKGKVKLMFEINQPWDWNGYWNNSLYMNDEEYKTSCQPSVVYAAVVDLDTPGIKTDLKPVGHGHYSGKTGELFTDLSTITTALHIAEKVTANVK